MEGSRDKKKSRKKKGKEVMCFPLIDSAGEEGSPLPQLRSLLPYISLATSFLDKTSAISSRSVRDAQLVRQTVLPVLFLTNKHKPSCVHSSLSVLALSLNLLACEDGDRKRTGTIFIPEAKTQAERKRGGGGWMLYRRMSEGGRDTVKDEGGTRAVVVSLGVEVVLVVLGLERSVARSANSVGVGLAVRRVGELERGTERTRLL